MNGNAHHLLSVSVKALLRFRANDHDQSPITLIRRNGDYYVCDHEGTLYCGPQDRTACRVYDEAVAARELAPVIAALKVDDMMSRITALRDRLEHAEQVLRASGNLLRDSGKTLGARYADQAKRAIGAANDLRNLLVSTSAPLP